MLLQAMGQLAEMLAATAGAADDVDSQAVVATAAVPGRRLTQHIILRKAVRKQA
jgi:hypothetical protein